MVLCCAGSLPLFLEAFCDMQDAQWQGTTPSEYKETQPPLQPSPVAETMAQVNPSPVAETEAPVDPTNSQVLPPDQTLEGGMPEEPAASVSEFPAPALSKSAIDKRLRRVFEPRVDGTYLVDAQFLKQYANKGADREKICQMFEKCNYDPDILAEIMF